MATGVDTRYTLSAAEASKLNHEDPTAQAVYLGDVIKSITDIVYGLSSETALNFSEASPGTNTTGSLVSTGSTWITHATAGACAMKLLCASSATSGDYATLRMRARSDGVNATGGVVCINGAASAGVNDYANLYAVQGYAQPLTYTQSNASNIVCGVYSCVQRTTTSSGRDWSLWTDTHATVKATGGTYLHRLSHNGGAINLDGIWTIYPGQGSDYLFNFETANTVAPVSACTGTTPAADGVKIAIRTATGTYYLRAATAWT